ncbi:MAG: BON domain-containing protein [Bryobacteraceae bacterium]|jgi:osmotically-inducible protein OsmY
MTRAIVLLFAVLLAFGPAWASQASDDKIYDQVRLKLVSDPDVKGGALDVQVKDGVVTLRGAVTSDRGKQKAERLTKKVKGVHSVVNELTIKVQ